MTTDTYTGPSLEQIDAYCDRLKARLLAARDAGRAVTLSEQRDVDDGAEVFTAIAAANDTPIVVMGDEVGDLGDGVFDSVQTMFCEPSPYWLNILAPTDMSPTWTVVRMSDDSDEPRIVIDDLEAN